MKKNLIITITIIVVTISAGAATYVKYKQSKVPNVSENPTIPYFIDSFMTKEREKIFLATDTTTNNYRLNKLGFNGKNDVTLNQNTLNGIKELYITYDSIYPNHQFINFKCLKYLLNRFDLTYGSPTNYIGDIPTNNITDMEKFKFSYLFDRATNYGIYEFDYNINNFGELNDGYGSINAFMEYIYTPIKNNQGDQIEGYEKIETPKHINNLSQYAKWDFKNRNVPNKTFLIIAPKSHFKGEINQNGNFGEIKDPIVLAPVDGGYIIVTAW